MLLEYNVDTKDEQLVEKAIELRKRVASRKLGEATEMGVINEDGLSKMRDKNRGERKEHMRENFSVTMAGVHERISVGRAEHQLSVQGQVRLLERDLGRASRLSKSKVEVLSDLEKRILAMRAKLQDPTPTIIDEQINNALHTNNALQLEKKFGQCTHCSRKILTALLGKHQTMCIQKRAAGEKEPVFHLQQDIVTSLATFPPQPPRNCRAIAKGCTFIEWEWDAPVLDGGLPVTDYEISFTAKILDFDRETDKYKKWEERQSSLRTSRWCMRDPIRTLGYRIRFLRAATEYTDFKIRCCNLRGWSEWRDMLPQHVAAAEKSDSFFVELDPEEQRKTLVNLATKRISHAIDVQGQSIFTDEPECPSPPLFFQCTKVTSSCLHLQWDAPFYDGGAEIVRYILHYTVLEKVITVTSRDHVIETVKRLKIRNPNRHRLNGIGCVVSTHEGGVGVAPGDGPCITDMIVRNLPSDSEIVNIGVCAVNNAGLVSSRETLRLNQHHKQSPLRVLRTLPSSRYTQLSRELARAAESKEQWIDTSFFMNTQQRLLRVELMRTLQEELSVTPPDSQELQEAKEWAAISEIGRAKEARKKALEEEQKQRLLLEAQALDSLGTEEEDELVSLASSLTGFGGRAGLGNSRGGGGATAIQSFEFSFRQRRQHYKKKLFALDRRLEELQNEKYEIDKQRTVLTFRMRDMEKKHMVFKLELERLKQYRGDTIVSSVLYGSNMQYQIKDYKDRVEKAHNDLIRDIADAKFKIISGENRRQGLKKDLHDTAEHRQERNAKFLEFDHNYQRTLKAMQRLKSGEPVQQRLQYYFNKLRDEMTHRQGERDRVTNMFLKMIYRLKRSAFKKWKSGEFHFASSDTTHHASLGSVMLQQASEKRIELQGLLRQAIAASATLKQKLYVAKLSHGEKNKLVNSANFKQMEEGIDHMKLHAVGMHFLYEGDGYALENKFDLAHQMYEAQILLIRSKPSAVPKKSAKSPRRSAYASTLVMPPAYIKMLAICHGRMGKMFLNMAKYNRAIVDFDRQLSLAREIDDTVEEADAYFGMGSGYLQVYDYENALRYLNVAQGLFSTIGNLPKYSGALRSIYDCYDRLNKRGMMAFYKEKIDATEDGLKGKVKHIRDSLDDMKGRLISTTAEIEHVVKMERRTYRSLQLQRGVESKMVAIKELGEDFQEQEERCKEIEALLDAIQGEMSAAIESDDLEMWSALVHDQPQIVEIEELKTRLKHRSDLEQLRYKEEAERLNRIRVKIKNAEDDIDAYEQELQLEDGALMTHARNDKPFRCIAFCAANAAGNEVTGTASGGFEEFVTAEGYNLHFIDYHSGSLNAVVIGDTKGIIRETRIGHTGVVTALLHDGNLIFSGSADETIICWQTQTREKLREMVGHEGTIVSLAVESTILVSGSADATLRLWNKHTGVQLRVVYGHSKSVLSVEIGSSWMLTGSADHEVRVWKIEHRSRHTVVAECTYRLIGHETAVTCVSYGKLEVLSGDTLGRIFIWWMNTGQVLRRCQVHKGPVKCMQFDALHIVSGGVDMCVCITDIATGEVLQSLRAHTGHVLAVAFDTERILSASADNTVRYWTWGNKVGPQDKCHQLDKGETLLTVSKQYGTSVANLMKWNGIMEMRQVHMGMKLIVRKGDPSAMTEAEKFAKERELRQTNGLANTTRKLKNSAGDVGQSSAESILGKYDRVHKLATDIDFFSMGNRMFGREKRLLELFPQTRDPNSDTKTLAARISHAASDAAKGGGGLLLEDAIIQQSKVRPRMFVSAENEDEWGAVADQLGDAMLSIMVEYEAYAIVLEQKRNMRSSRTITGRMNTYEKMKRDGTLLPQITEAGEAAAARAKELAEKSAAMHELQKRQEEEKSQRKRERKLAKQLQKDAEEAELQMQQQQLELDRQMQEKSVEDAAASKGRRVSFSKKPGSPIRAKKTNDGDLFVTHKEGEGSLRRSNSSKKRKQQQQDPVVIRNPAPGNGPSAETLATLARSTQNPIPVPLNLSPRSPTLDSPQRHERSSSALFGRKAASKVGLTTPGSGIAESSLEPGGTNSLVARLVRSASGRAGRRDVAQENEGSLPKPPGQQEAVVATSDSTGGKRSEIIPFQSTAATKARSEKECNASPAPSTARNKDFSATTAPTASQVFDELPAKLGRGLVEMDDFLAPRTHSAGPGQQRPRTDLQSDSSVGSWASRGSRGTASGGAKKTPQYGSASRSAASIGSAKSGGSLSRNSSFRDDNSSIDSAVGSSAGGGSVVRSSSSGRILLSKAASARGGERGRSFKKSVSAQGSSASGGSGSSKDKRRSGSAKTRKHQRGGSDIHMKKGSSGKGAGIFGSLLRRSSSFSSASSGSSKLRPSAGTRIGSKGSTGSSKGRSKKEDRARSGERERAPRETGRNTASRGEEGDEMPIGAVSLEGVQQRGMGASGDGEQLLHRDLVDTNMAHDTGLDGSHAERAGAGAGGEKSARSEGRVAHRPASNDRGAAGSDIDAVAQRDQSEGDEDLSSIECGMGEGERDPMNRGAGAVDEPDPGNVVTVGGSRKSEEMEEQRVRAGDGDGNSHERDNLADALKLPKI